MGEPAYLNDHFLIAMPSLADPNFSHTVTYICDHNDEGAMGVVINRPLHIHLADIAQQIELDQNNPLLNEIPVYQGGPVQTDRGFVLHQPQGNWEATMAITDSIALTMSRDIIAAIINGIGPKQYIIALGYAGWGSGQLEQEIAANAWLNGPADISILFDEPVEERWTSSAALLGVDLTLLSTDVGHA